MADDIIPLAFFRKGAVLCHCVGKRLSNQQPSVKATRFGELHANSALGHLFRLRAETPAESTEMAYNSWQSETNHARPRATHHISS